MTTHLELCCHLNEHHQWRGKDWACEQSHEMSQDACEDCNVGNYPTPIHAATHLYLKHPQVSSLFDETRSLFDMSFLQYFVREKGTLIHIPRLPHTDLADMWFGPQTVPNLDDGLQPVSLVQYCSNPRVWLADSSIKKASVLQSEEIFMAAISEVDLFKENMKSAVEFSHLPANSGSVESLLESTSEESFMFNCGSTPSDGLVSDGEADAILIRLGTKLVMDFSLESPLIRKYMTRSSDSAEGSNPSPYQGNSEDQYAMSNATTYTSLVQEPEREDGEGPRPPKRPRIDEISSHSAVTDLLLACPYAKHDINTYSELNRTPNQKLYRRCASTYITGIPRLKQHLYRVHQRPEHYCSRCFIEFSKKEELENHSRQTPACLTTNCPFEEKMTMAQFKAIKRRKPGRTTANSWFDIFNILFPDSILPSNPHVSRGPESPPMEIIRQFCTFVEREAPSGLAAILGPEVYGDSEPWTLQHQFDLAQILEESLRILMPEILSRFEETEESAAA
jgi:hypothetical protein